MVGGSSSTDDSSAIVRGFRVKNEGELPSALNGYLYSILKSTKAQRRGILTSLLKQFDDVLLYLNSIKSYFYNDDTFNFNYGQAKAAVGK